MRSREHRTVIFNNMVTPYTNRLYNELAASGVDLSVASCVEQESNRSWADSIEKRYEATVIPGWSVRISTSRYAHLNHGIWRRLDRLRPDALIINGFYPSMLIAAAWASFRRVPLGLTIDGWRHTMPQTRYHRIVRPLVIGQCRVIITCGRKGAQFFQEEGVSEDRLVTAPLVPAWDGPATLRNFAERPYDVVWAAHLNNDVKNARFFGEAIVRLKTLKPDLRVRIVGAGPARQELLERLTGAGVEWTYDGVVDWRAMKEVFSTARLLLLPSLWEPWGLVCNEAMQCGTPCLVSPFVGAGDDLITPGVNGEVCELNADLWAARAASLLNGDRWQAYSTRARVAASERSLVNGPDASSMRYPF